MRPKHVLLATLLTVPIAASVATPALAAPAEPERVIMQLPEFLKLYESAKKKKDEPEKAPRDFAVSSAHYEGEVLLEDDEARFAVFSAKVRIAVLKDKGWVRVPVLPATVALQSARMAGREAPVVIENGFYTLVTNRRGAFDLDLKFGAAVTTSKGSSQISFQLAQSGATDIVLSVPARDDLDFVVANARIQRDRTDGGKRIVEATLPSTGSLSIRWQREIPEAKKQEPRVYAEVYTLVGLSDGLMRATTTIHHTILFAGKEKLQVKVPEGMTVLEVQGAGIRDWKQGDKGSLDVLLNYAAEGAYPLTVVMEKSVGQDVRDVEAPLCVPLGVERMKGWVGVESRGNLEIGAGDVVGATPVDVRSLPAAILGITGQPVLLGYKYLGSAVTIPLLVSDHDDVDVLVTLLDQTRARTMWTVDGRRLTSVKYQVRNNRRQFLRLALPAKAELWSASVGGRAVQPAKASDGRVLIPLVRSQAMGGALAAFEVEVVYVESGEPTPKSGRGSFAAELPRADAPSTYVAWTVYAPEDAKIRKRTIDGSFEHVEYLSDPIPAEDAHFIETETPQVQQEAAVQARGGAMGEGAVPVPVSLPLQGEAIYFEKLLALDEKLEVLFDYRGLRR
jgi:hypothetical protein